MPEHLRGGKKLTRRARDAIRILGDLIPAIHRPRSEDTPDVPREVVQTIVADRQAEVLGRHVFELVCLVHDGVAAVRDHLAEFALTNRGVRAQEVMVHDDHVGLRGALTHPDDETLLKARTLRPDAVLGRRRDVVPERQVFGQILDFGAIAGLGLPGPLVDCLDVEGVARGPRELEAGS